MQTEQHLSLEIGGKTFVAPCFGIVLYTSENLSRHPDAVQGALQTFERLCPRDLWSWYRTENMSKRQRVTARTGGLLSAWLASGAPARDTIAIDINTGTDWDTTSEFNFSVYGEEIDPDPDNVDARWIYLTVPLAFMVDRLQELEQAAMSLFESLPFVSGYAGPVLEGSLYRERESQRFAWATAMRYRGFDFCDAHSDCNAVAHDGLKTVSWLTFLGQALTAEFGGTAALGKRVAPVATATALRTGTCLKAGDRPELGDRHRGERLKSYETVFKACEPAIDRFINRHDGNYVMQLGGDERDKTVRYLRRLAYEDA